MTYDDWKTTEPRDEEFEIEDARREAWNEAELAYDDAADFASLCESLGLEPEPIEAAIDRAYYKAMWDRGMLEVA